MNHLFGYGGDMRRQVYLINFVKQSCRFCHGTAFYRDCAMAARPLYFYFHPAGLFFSHLDRVKFLSAYVCCTPAEFADGEPDTGK